eukprot:7530824-Alexandrium_andersonii.AAC.1
MDTRLRRVAGGAGIDPLRQLCVGSLIQAAVDARAALAAGLKDLLEGGLRSVPLKPLKLLSGR